MPELPEVEIVRQSLSKNIVGKKINKILIRNRNLRFKIRSSFKNHLKNKRVDYIKCNTSEINKVLKKKRKKN